MELNNIGYALTVLFWHDIWPGSCLFESIKVNNDLNVGPFGAWQMISLWCDSSMKINSTDII